MSDYNSSLPIRTENDGDVSVLISDSLVPSQKLKVNSDGSLNITDNSGSITIDANDLDIRDLVFATDKVDVSGSEVSLSPSSLSALESITVQNGSGASAVNIQDGGNSITVDGSVTVSATDLDIRNLSATQDNVAVANGANVLSVNSDGSINVKISDSTPGTPISTYLASVAVASGASVNNTYTATGNFNLYQVEASASGKMKIEVQVNGVSKFVQFNSTANPNMSIKLNQELSITTGQTINIIMTNKDNNPHDLYSTIIGALV